MERAEQIIRESARFGWPGRMSDILKKSSKQTTEDFLSENIDLDQMTRLSSQQRYDAWHKNITLSLAVHLTDAGLVRDFSPKSRHQAEPYQPEAVSAKLIDLFTYALAKHPPFRLLYPFLHLPLDEVARQSLLRLQKRGVFAEQATLTRNIYALSYDEHMELQEQLWALVDGEFSEMKDDLHRSRVWLNIPLWVK